MKLKHRWPAIIIGLIFIFVLAIGVAAVFAQASDDEDESGGEGDGGTVQILPGSRFGLWPNPRRVPDSIPQGPIARLRRSDINRDQLLADALNISLQELHDAREEARNAGIQQAVDEEIITQEEADILLAVITFRGTMDKKELVAEALGISLDDLEQAREDGLRMRELLEELALSPADVREGLREAFEAAVEDAVLSGEITEEQGELILNFERPGRLFPRIGPFSSRHPRGLKNY